MFRPNNIEKDRDEHCEDLAERFSKICEEFDDIDNCYNRLKQTISTSPMEKEMFLSILRHLLFIDKKGFSRPVYYELIENSISQIVLRERGHDPWSVIRMRIARDRKNVKVNLEPFRKKSPKVSLPRPPIATSGGIPPSQPPPLATSGGILPSLPPPPGQSISTTKIKLPHRKDWPKSKTKIIPWKKIEPHKVKSNSLWAQITEDALITDNLMDDIEKEFETKAEKKKEVSEKLQRKSSQIITQKEMSLLIVLAKHARNQSYESVKKSVLRCDTEVLSESFLKSLIDIMESIENVPSLYKEYVDKYNTLVKADQFCITISSIESVVERLKCLLFKQRYKQIKEECEKALKYAINACQVVKRSKNFSKVLEYTLMIGNIMNSGSYNAKAIGFDITYLTKVILFIPIFIKNIHHFNNDELYDTSLLHE